MNFNFPVFSFRSRRSRLGVSLREQTPVAVRAERSIFGRIRHAEVVWPPASAPGQNGPVWKTAGCIGIQESLTLWLDTPLSSKRKVIRVLPSMLDVQLPFPLEDCCYSFIRFRRRKAGNGISVLAVAARRAAVQRCLDQYRAAGIDPLIIDHEGLALWQQSLSEHPPRSGTARVVAALEPDHIALVVGKGELFINAHSLQTPAGSGAVSEELFQRVRRILCAELPSGAAVEWVFCGLLARQTALINSFHRLLNNEWPGPCVIHQSPENFLPRALSARALENNRASCNLRQGELTHPAALAARRKHARLSALLLLLTGILLCVFNLAWQFIASSRFKDAQREIARLTAELAPGRAVTYGREAEEMRPVMQKQLEDFSPLLNVFAEPLSIRMAAVINAGREAGLAFTRFAISREKITINGTAAGGSRSENLAEYLKNMGYNVVAEQEKPGSGAPAPFVIKANIPGAGGLP